MPLLKSVPVPETQVPEVPVVSSEVHAGLEWMGVPMDVYRHFGVEVSTVDEREAKKLKDIYEWSKQGSVDLGSALMKINQIETQMGAADLGSRRYDKIWNYVRLSGHIDDLSKRREALKR